MQLFIASFDTTHTTHGLLLHMPTLTVVLPKDNNATTTRGPSPLFYTSQGLSGSGQCVLWAHAQRGGTAPPRTSTAAPHLWLS